MIDTEKPIREVTSFANMMSAKMAGTKVEDYRSNHDKALRVLDEIEKAVNKAKVNTIDDYRELMKLKSLLSSLYCYTFNNQYPEFDRVAELEAKLGKKLYKLARGYKRIKDKETRAVAKYFITCWQHYYIDEDLDKMSDRLLESGNLFLDKRGNYLVTGLHYAVGDNVFGVSWDSNREYRLYVKTCAIQAFYIKSRIQKYLKANNVNAPSLDEELYKKTHTETDSKYSARVYLTRVEHRIIRSKF
ncbi:MAG TPA: hypothetical protein ENH28_01635 [Euryarchaeota archaeon]|nr:hypothetical protein [Euryarchaeota archaeon]